MSGVALLSPGRRIAVLGAAGGIGRSLVDACLAHGCEVAALDLPASLAGWTPPSGVRTFAVDATDEASVKAAFAGLAEAFDGLDGFVNLAGFTAAREPLAEMDLATFEEVTSGNLRSAFLSARAALPLLRRGEAPAMVLVSSGLALKPTPGYGPYSAAKAGVLALTRLLAQENAPLIRVNAVAPGAVETPFLTGGTGRSARESNFEREAYVRQVPLARMARPGDVTGPIMFLLGPASAYITGQTLHVNGGLLMV
ncbi:MAG: SDR family oxidoreductase [Salinarimonadaceae bacterium]|nr:MAG: SDR family oxidoreductase [Salinarimonadaceae bacterium]